MVFKVFLKLKMGKCLPEPVCKVNVDVNIVKINNNIISVQ